jgi:ATP-dependent DNA helicase RecQ
VFGVGKDHLTETQWRAVVRQLLAQGLLAVEGDYGTLVLTEASTPVLRKQRQIMLRQDPSPAAKARTAKSRGAGPAAAELPEADAAVFEQLRAWRAAAAKEQGVPAYVIFHDATLREIAVQGPASLAELARVNGVGEAKLARYGQQILDLLQAPGDAEPGP